MWFNPLKKKSNESKEDNCQSMLASIDSNGINLSMKELLLYQSKTALIDLSARKNIHGKMSGNYLSRSKGSGMEFDEVRHYQTGDDVRAIDWRVTARTGKTHTKLFREEVERPVLIATDLSESMFFGSLLLFKSVQSAHLASLVAWHAKLRGDRIGGIVFNQNLHMELKPRSRKEGVLHYLHALTNIHDKRNQIKTENSNYFESNCARIRKLAKPGSLVYLITDAQQIGLSPKPTFSSATSADVSTKKQTDVKTIEENALRHLTQINQHCELVICLIVDPLEQKLPESKSKLNVTLTDGTNRQKFTLGDKKTAHNYQQQASIINKKRYDLLMKTGARVIQFSSGETLEAQLKNGAQFCNQ